jgi:hypothetical protein
MHFIRPQKIRLEGMDAFLDPQDLPKPTQEDANHLKRSTMSSDN